MAPFRIEVRGGAFFFRACAEEVYLVVYLLIEIVYTQSA